METYVLFLVLGLGVGAIYAALAQAVVLSFRGSGVVNFAQGAMAVYTAYVFSEVQREGSYFLPPLPNPLALVEGVANRWLGGSLDLPDWPTRVDIGTQSSLVAFAVAMATAALLGLGAHFLVFRPLRDAPALAKVVASVGLMLVLQAIVGVRFGTSARSVENLLPDHAVRLPVGVVPIDRFFLLGLTVAVSAGLWAIYRFTTFGLATRAAAESEKGAVLIGYSPDRLAALNWVLATLLSGVVGILVAPITSLSPGIATGFLIPALGAALLGGFRSFSLAAVAGLGMGMLQSVITVLRLDLTWFPQIGTREVLPFVVIVAVIVVRGRGVPGRGVVGDGRLPDVPAPAHVTRAVVVLVPLAAAAVTFLPFELRSAVINSLVGVVISLSLVVLVGFVGQISLAQMAVAGVAGFLLSTFAASWGVPFPLAPVLAALVATAAGLLIALPGLRVRGVSLAVVTLAAAFAVEELVFKNPSWTRGGQGLRVPAPSVFGFRFGQTDSFFLGDGKTPNPAFGLFLVAVATLLALAVVNLRRSDTGRRMLAVRSNERAAAAVGINVAGTKMLAFGMSAFIAGIGGCLIAYRFESVSEASFTTLASVTALATAYLGGITSVSGAVIAGTLAIGGIGFHITESLFHTGQFAALASGIGLITMAIAHPEGLAGTMRHIKGHHRGRSPASEGADDEAVEERVEVAAS